MTPKDKRRNIDLRRRYGITLAEYKAIHKKQKGRCAICGRHQREFKRQFDVDHNHKSGYVRGLLCPYCNRKLLVYLRDDKNRTVGLVSYLQGAIDGDKNWG